MRAIPVTSVGTAPSKNFCNIWKLHIISVINSPRRRQSAGYKCEALCAGKCYSSPLEFSLQAVLFNAKPPATAGAELAQRAVTLWFRFDEKSTLKRELQRA